MFIFIDILCRLFVCMLLVLVWGFCPLEWWRWRSGTFLLATRLWFNAFLQRYGDVEALTNSCHRQPNQFCFNIVHVGLTQQSCQTDFSPAVNELNPNLKDFSSHFVTSMFKVGKQKS